MVAWAGAVAAGRQAAERDDADTVARLSRWLLLAVGLDLILGRLVVRLTIFIPKDESLATVGAVVGRIAAATDVLVPIVGVLLLGALLLRAGRNADPIERVLLVGLSVVAGGGLLIAYVPPTPGIVVTLDLLVAAVAIMSGIRIGRPSGAPILARVGLVALAGTIAAAAIGRLVGVAGFVAGPGQAWPSEEVGLTAGAVGQVAFVVGAALVGLAGIRIQDLSARPARVPAVVGVAVAIVVMLAGVGTPATWGVLEIWSLGLTGLVPAPAIALALGLAVGGLPALYGRAPAAAVGASIVLFAGYGLAASGLILAALLGLIVASDD